MALSNTIKIALVSAAGAVVVSSTVLFPLIKDLNTTITEDKPIHTPTDSETNKTIQVITKDEANTDFKSSAASRIENPSMSSESVGSTNDPKLQSSDTIKSNILIEDIPHYKRN
jgi:hypothetical protein